MPELPVKEVRLSELHLPEIKRDEIARALSEVRLPSVDLSKVERPRIDLPDGIGRIDWRSIDVTGALAGVAAIARMGRPVLRRSRWTLAAGVVVVAGIAAAVLLARPAVRERAGRSVRDLRAMIETRAAPTDVLEIEDDVLTSTEPTEPLSTEASAPSEDVAVAEMAVADVEEAGSPA